MQYHVLSKAHIDHIRAIARELGNDWYYHEISSHARCGKLRSRAERHVWIHFMVSKDRFLLSAGLDRNFYNYGEHQLISVALGRKPGAIAAEIRSRLLPGLTDTIAKAHAWRARTAATNERNGWLQNLLCKLCNSLYSRVNAGQLFEYLPPGGPRFAVNESSNRAGGYDLTLNNLTLDDVVRIAAVVCQGQQGKTDETS
ncbi:hypothetical protein [Pantoea sp.]|jgi:hypothetical protein|uniref:hypothetical protein n=1 Tax=Pantoea sp. TaxID=69393 RepID=UPI0029152E62|nr:hypothetical protein [Pantoea sp.]MDU4129802.1 hypothetical protein [Pantoea sp.]